MKKFILVVLFIFPLTCFADYKVCDLDNGWVMRLLSDMPAPPPGIPPETDNGLILILPADCQNKVLASFGFLGYEEPIYSSAFATLLAAKLGSKPIRLRIDTGSVGYNTRHIIGVELQ